MSNRDYGKQKAQATGDRSYGKTRFADGGIVGDDDVGLKRFLMGNKDDANSEAGKRWGVAREANDNAYSQSRAGEGSENKVSAPPASASEPTMDEFGAAPEAAPAKSSGKREEAWDSAAASMPRASSATEAKPDTKRVTSQVKAPKKSNVFKASENYGGDVDDRQKRPSLKGKDPVYRGAAPNYGPRDPRISTLTTRAKN